MSVALDQNLFPAEPAELSSSQIKVEIATENAGNPRQFILALGAFITCFAAAASISGVMPTLKERMNLTEAQRGVALAMPMLMGALARIPLGMLADKFGGRRVFIALMSLSLLPLVAMPLVQTYWQLLACAFLLGIPLGIFSVGVAFVSDWYPARCKGTALGLLGFGYIGTSLALFGAPRAVAHLGYAWGFWVYAVALGAWTLAIAFFARNAPQHHKSAAKGIVEYLRPLRDPRSWMLSLYYFLTFGGCLAMAAYLPNFLTLTFHLDKGDAGLRAGGFVALAVCMRPVGGWLSDRVGGRRVLIAVFPAVAVMAIFMACPLMITFTIGALGMAFVIGLGNGAIFELLPGFFPRSVGTVTGLVGAAGALGGFFPPFVLGFIRQQTGSFTWGFVLLAIVALLCEAVHILLLPAPTRTTLPRS